jgi:hypothetical protein
MVVCNNSNDQISSHIDRPESYQQPTANGIDGYIFMGGPSYAIVKCVDKQDMMHLATGVQESRQTR